VRRFFYGAVDLETVQPAALAAGADIQESALLGRLDQAVASLPKQLKEPLLLTVFEGLSQQDAGAALGITAKAVETRVYRARKLLGDMLGAESDED
jgi:RNA polymerase sigma-70 factor (ECF subfamily)